MLHWEDVIDVSKCHRVADFLGDAPHTPLMGAKMSLCDVSHFQKNFAIKKGGIV